MNTANKSAGDCAVISSTTPTGTVTGALVPVPMPVRRARNGAVAIAALIDEYMLAYAGRDSSRAQRLRRWITQLSFDGGQFRSAVCAAWTPNQGRLH
jgi:hypothetical protein